MHTKIKSYLNILSIISYYVSKIRHAKCLFSSFPDLQSNETKLCRRTTFFGFILTQIVAVVTLFLKLSFWNPMPDDTYDVDINTRKDLLVAHTNTTLKLYC